MATTLDYARLANDCYDVKSSGNTGSWVRVDIDTPELLKNDKSGFQAQVYRNMDSNEIVVAYAGTNDWIDVLCEDIPMAFFCAPDQIEDARNLYRYVSENYPDADISVTGHSLGGTLAYAISAETGCDAVTFNNPGSVYLTFEGGLKNIGIAINAHEYLSKYDLVSIVMKHGDEDNVTKVDLGLFNHGIKNWVEYLENGNTITFDAESLQPYMDAFTAMQNAITDIVKAQAELQEAMQTYLPENIDTLDVYAQGITAQRDPIVLDLNGNQNPQSFAGQMPAPFRKGRWVSSNFYFTSFEKAI